MTNLLVLSQSVGEAANWLQWHSPPAKILAWPSAYQCHFSAAILPPRQQFWAKTDWHRVWKPSAMEMWSLCP